MQPAPRRCFRCSRSACPALPPPRCCSGVVDPGLASRPAAVHRAEGIRLGRHQDLQEQLKPPNGGVFLVLNGVVIKSPGGSDAGGVADAINLGYKTVLKELHSK